MTKEGHSGIVNNAQQPIIKKIDKVELSKNLIKSSVKKVVESSPTHKNSHTPLAGQGRQSFNKNTDSRLTSTPG